MRSEHNVSAATRSLDIRLWHELGLNGNPIPVTIPLEGDSMRPLIRRGCDCVTIVPLNRPLKTGDIVLFHSGGDRYVVHRVWTLKDGMVQTLGDNCWNPDAWIPLESVWGLVVRMERDGRKYVLDSRCSRVFGIIWMGIHPMRMHYRRLRQLGGRILRRLGRGHKNDHE